MSSKGGGGAAAAAICIVLSTGVAGRARADQSCPEGGASADCEEKRPPNVDRVPDLSSMKAPEAPAFMALGVSPSEIQRPSTPTEFAMALASGVAKGTSLSPLDNFAIQASPYWLVKHPDLTKDDLDHHELWAPVRNFSLSAASTAAKLDGGTLGQVDARRWAVGARTTIFPGWQSRAAVACSSFLLDVVDHSSAALAQSRAVFEAKWDLEHPKPPITLAAGPDSHDPKFLDQSGKFNDAAFEAAVAVWRAARESLRASEGPAFVAWARARDAARDEWLAGYDKARVSDPRVHGCITTIHDRVGFMAELAGAFSMTLPEGDFQKLPALRTRLQTYWLTAGYVLEGDPDSWHRHLDISLLGVGRYQSEVPGLGDSVRRLDAGGRIVLAWDRYGVSAETTTRHQTTMGETLNLYRVGFTVDTRLSGGAWASVTFGKDFGATGSTPLIALANLQWNLGIDRQLAIDSTLTQKKAGEAP